METRPQPPSASNADPFSSATPPDAPRRRQAPPKRKASSSGAVSSALSKRLAKDRFSPPVHSGPVTRARQSPNKVAPAAPDQYRAPDVCASTGDELGSSRDTGFVQEVEDAGVEKEEPFVDLEFESVRSRGSDVHVVPTHVGWFRWKKVHLLEEQCMTSFFDGKTEGRTADVYVQIRDAIIKKFHENPQMQIDGKYIEELAVGDLEARQEVLEFLDHWGLINFHPYLPGELDAKDAEDVSKSKDFETPGEVKSQEADGTAKDLEADGTAKDPEADEGAIDFSLLEKLFNFDVAPLQATASSAPKIAGLPASSVQPPLLTESTSNIFEEMIRSEESSVEYHCNACSADCSWKRYHCQRQADFDLCAECYGAKKFGQGMGASDFILMDSSVIRGSGGSWTDQENLLLLEALELFGANWNEIAEHVATKSQTQCILHFIQMPIEDPFLCESSDPDAVHGNSDQTTANVEANISDNSENNDPKKSESNQTSVCHTNDVDISDACEKLDNVNKNSSNVILSALTRAFQVIGHSPEQGSSLSFAESGNPVMALAAFIAGVVEPDSAVISTKSSLQAIYEDSPGIQLATRHCFALEDPPIDIDDRSNDHNNLLALESGIANEENQAQLHNQSETQNENANIDKIEQTEKELLLSTKKSITFSKEFLEENLDASEPSSRVIDKNEATCSPNGVCDAPHQGECHSANLPDQNANDGAEVLKDPTQEGCFCAANTIETDCIDSEDKTKSVKNSKNVDLAEEENIKSVQKSDNLDSAEDNKTSVDGNMLCSTNGDGKGHEELIPSHSGNGNVEKVEPNEKGKELNIRDMVEDKNYSKSLDTGYQNDYKKIKRAAVTALAAAAVKAKVFARQEEDQIRQLACFVIGKQLKKLEIKLGLLNAVDGAVMRMREQLDPTRRKLFHERSQIIAARYGTPASSSRPLQGSLPMRFPAGHGNAGPRQPNATFQNQLATRP